ncbi:MAG: LpxI family protein [Rhodobacterales bacterium]|nr:LpxI family protein [Rhodobacterales bacterium]NCT12585.1 LpxI family protein [Rhodobacterales bacterium]
MLALLAGTGALPGVLVAARRGDVIICEMPGFPVTGTGAAPRLSYRIETLGTLLATLRARGVTEVCLAGAIRRPQIDMAAIDDATLPLVARLMEALGQGDDGALRVVIAVIEEAGFTVRAAHEIVPQLLPAPGVLTRARPGAAHLRDIARAEAAHAALAAADIGQACVVRDGQVVALEASPGTDWMLQSLRDGAPGPRATPDPLLWAVDTAGDLIGGWADWLSGDAPLPARPSHGIAAGGLLYKAPKPGQDRRADLPVIGPETVIRAAEAGLCAIVIAAGGVMVIDAAQVTAMADARDMVLWVRPTS